MVDKEPAVQTVALDLVTTTDLDTQSAIMIGELKDDLERIDIVLVLTNVVTPVREMLDKAGILDAFDPDSILPSVAAAELAFLVRNGDDEAVAHMQAAFLENAAAAIRTSMAYAPDDRKVSLEQIANNLDGLSSPQQDRESSTHQ